MRFVKTPARSVSSVTNKGWNGRSHHPKREIDFVAVDGEGMTLDNGEHRYVLFGIGEKQIEDEYGLDWEDCFKFLYEEFKPDTAYVGFFLGYDFTQMLRTLPKDRAWMLLTREGRALRKHRIQGKHPHPVDYNGWQFDILGMKRLRIRPKLCKCVNATCQCDHASWMYVCDVGPFFQTSFLHVIDPSEWPDDNKVVSDDEYALIEAGKRHRELARLDDDMRRYNRLENVVLSRVMNQLNIGLKGIGIHLPPSKWFGPGQAAQMWLKNEGAPTGEQVIEIAPKGLLEAARMSYIAGWFEIFMHGIIPGDVHEYDLNSAYPYIISTLPCLLHGIYSQGEGIPNVSPGEICLVYARLLSPNLRKAKQTHCIGSMLHRDGHGRILRPLATEGWYWWDELQAGMRAGLVSRLDNRGRQQVLHWMKYTPCDCPPPMRNIANLYEKRVTQGKKSVLGRAAKYPMNSCYGKFAQSVGDPVFSNPIYASRITSGCRRLLLEAIATHPKKQRAVAMVATDGVYFTSPHPKLPVSNRLGEWECKTRTNLTLFKPGVYWDDEVRMKIVAGVDPSFKARGFRASDFANSIEQIDRIYQSWKGIKPGTVIQCADWQWPSVDFISAFGMVTALQALRRGKWDTAGEVSNDITLTQNADPSDKRCCIFWEEETNLYRSTAYPGMILDPSMGRLQWIPSTPYTKRFGMENPWSDEMRESLGVSEDGLLADILMWMLK